MRRAFSMIPVALLCAFVTCERAIAAELHPIVEVQTGYFFGTVSGGKWLKAAESAKSGDGEDEVLINATIIQQRR
jgi:hypothetical protein